ncbi:T-cell immunoglobulin and mucin domain-containing protein 4 [Diceros bicornis minor]|uniref:T-cell immunoglobulin and mucin domain-containing protein 4 n=1 Tax=Diceros bicornis minor TaxID=77932 RepID=UPI0026ED36A8|nr:T-cell immunoglobulin and mucin domain-containing protein 4 [Diceros bicornis minor]
MRTVYMSTRKQLPVRSVHRMLLQATQQPASTASEIVVRAYLGQTVTLPCMYSSWSQNGNSMCWGKGQCPNSKCNEELLHTDGSRVLWSKSSKYKLQGNIQRGDVSLTISNTNEADSSVYCCRIEVPGWFNDVKKNIRLQLSRATTTTESRTTRRPTTTTAMTTSTAVLPTTVMTTPDLTTGTPLETKTTTALTTMATTCSPTTLSNLPEATTILLITEPSPEGPFLTEESETFPPSSDSQTPSEVTSGDTALFTSEESKDWVPQSTSQASMWEMSDLVTSPQPRAPETAIIEQNGVESEQIKMADNFELLTIIAPSLGFVLLALLVAFFLRGKVMKTNCFQKHTRLNNAGESKNVLDDMQHAREDEEGLFTL